MCNDCGGVSARFAVSNSSTRATEASLQAVKSSRIRNLLRGAISTADEHIAKRTLESLRKECPISDAEAVFRFLDESKLAHNIPNPTPFPVNASEVNQLPLYRGTRLEIELVDQALRIAREADKIVQAIHLIARLNSCILSRDLDGINAAFNEYREQFGLSLLIANKAISLRHSSLTSVLRRSAYGEVTEPFSSPRRQVLTVAFEDSVDNERDYMRVRRAFLDFVLKNQVDEADGVVLADLFSPRGQPPYDTALTAQAYSRWSVIDAVACLMRLRQLASFDGRNSEMAMIEAAIPASVRQAWECCFNTLDLEDLQTLVGIEDQFFDRRLFAHLPAWSEYPNLYDYRLRIELAIGERLDGRFPVQQRNASSIALPRNGVQDLLSKGQQFVQTSGIDPASSGAFNRTIALIASLEEGRLTDVDGETLCLLLDQTIDVSGMLSRDELVAFLPRRPSDKLYEFFRTALLNELENSKVSNHAVRRALQRLVQDQFGGNIVSFLEHIGSSNDHVAAHLYQLCTEAFLTELYDLFAESDDVTEAQASILEWRGKNRGDEDAAIRARSHRLNMKLRKVRGAIDETRIYVDPLRFYEWIYDTKITDMRALSPFASEIYQSTDTSMTLTEAVRKAVDPRLRLLTLLDDCYHEFCTNKIFGVTSFIGRRIRHGALHGHLVLEFASKVHSAIADLRTVAPKVTTFLTDWLANFDAAVLRLASDRLLVKSKEKPKGVIDPTLDETDKANAASRMLQDVARSMVESAELTHSIALVGDYCWAVFEIDLKRARAAVEDLRREFTIHIDEHCCGNVEVDRAVSDQIRQLNSEYQHRFDQVASWLTRPTSVSPSASIGSLFQVVFDESKLRYPEFKPDLEMLGEQDLDLIGHRFHHVYDALVILIDNAAKHGDRSGKLLFNVEILGDEDKFIRLRIAIKSDLPRTDRKSAIAKIDGAMLAEIGNAMVDNRQSGIRKLRSLVEALDELVAFNCVHDETTVTFTLDLRYPRS